MKCPVCKNTIPSHVVVCPICGFNEFHKEFVNVDDAKRWSQTTVLRYRRNWLQSLEDFDIHGSVLKKYCGSNKDVHLPYGVEIIDSYAFNNSNIQTIVVPETVISIGRCAFNGCKELKEIIIPDNVRFIKSECFRGCESLHRVKLSDGLIRIEERAFERCVSLTAIIIPDNVDVVESGVFSGCNSLEEITCCNQTVFSRNVLGISHHYVKWNRHSKEGAWYKSGDYLYQYAGAYEELDKIKDSRRNYMHGYYHKTHVEDGWFIRDAEHLHPFPATNFAEIPTSVSAISGNAFEQCHISRMLLNEYVEYIGPYAFADSEIEEIIIPDKIQTIHNGTFSGCRQLRRVLLPKGINRIGLHAFDGCRELTHIELPNGVEKIASWSFCDCKKIESIHFPDTLVSIDAYAFDRCSQLQLVEVSKKTFIHDHAFRGCHQDLRIKRY